MDYLYKDKKKSLTKMKKQQDKKGSHFLSGLGSFSYSSIKKLLWALMFFIFLYVFLIVVSPAPLREHQRLIPNEKLTIVMNTFKRHDLMEEAIDHYSKCNIVKYVYVVWSEPDPPTEAMISKFSSRSHPWVIFDIHKQDSLNNRFKPLPNPHTDSIFAVDDDMRVSCDDLALGYEVWRNSQRNLVGYMPRIHLRRSDGSLVYRCWWRVWWHGVYSIILTKAAFLHHDYLREYTENMPAQIRELVDQKRNCEDIAMQFLVANISSLPPIYVKGSLDVSFYFLPFFLSLLFF